ncbi:MAG: phage holin family protein [Flammeovirgaceae bacterium]|nr:phage holin family protein [Flammeovirgaceae bacterium]
MFKEIFLKFLNLENLVNHLTGFIETRVELVKYEIKEEIARTVSKILLVTLVGFILLMFIVFISFALAFELSDYYGRLIGFVAMGFMYLIVALIVYALRDTLTHKLEKMILESIKKK